MNCLLTSTNAIKNQDRGARRQLADAVAYAPVDAACAVTRRQHFSVWNEVMADILKVWRYIRNPTPQSMSIYLKNNPAKFHPDSIWNDGAVGISAERSPNNEKNSISRRDDRRNPSSNESCRAFNILAVSWFIGPLYVLDYIDLLVCY